MNSSGLSTIIAARLLVALFGAAVLAGAAPAAFAGNGNSPHTDPVAGTFALTTVSATQRSCVGQDGPYLEIVARQVGTAAGDPRLTGELETKVKVLLNAATGFGTSEGSLTLRDAATGRKKAEGGFVGVITPATAPPNPTFGLEGVIAARVRDTSGDADEELTGGGQLVANFTATFDAALNSTGEFGAPGGTNPAVIQNDHCTGPVTHTP